MKLRFGLINNRLRSSKDGVAALVTIIVVSIAALIMAYSSSILGLGELDIGYTSQRGMEAFHVADGCMEETLRRIRLLTSYGVGAGTISLTVSNGTCAIDVADLGGNQRQVIVLGTSGSYNKKIKVVLTLSSNVIAINSWEERND